MDARRLLAGLNAGTACRAELHRKYMTAYQRYQKLDQAVWFLVEG